MMDTTKRAIAKDPSNWKQQLYLIFFTVIVTSLASADLFFGCRMNSSFTKWLPKPNTPNPGVSMEYLIKQQDISKQFSKLDYTI